jgi:hypothetical protein
MEQQKKKTINRCWKADEHAARTVAWGKALKGAVNKTEPECVSQIH